MTITPTTLGELLTTLQATGPFKTMATIPTWQRVKIKYRDTAKRNFGYEIKDKEDSIWINPTKFTSPIKRTKALLAALWRLIPAKLQQDSPAITGGTMMRGGDAHFYAFQAIKALTPKQFIQALQSQNPKKQQQLARALSALELLITPDSPQLPPLKKKQQPQPQPSQQPLPTERPPKPILKLPSLPQLQPAPDISAIDEKTNYAKYEESEGEDEEPEPPAPQPPQLTPEATATFYMITKLGYTEGLPKEFKPLTQAWINFTQSLTDITEAINNLKKPKDKENFLDW